MIFHRSLLLICFLFVPFFGYTQISTKGNILKDRQFLMDKKEITASDTNGNFISVRPHRNNGTLKNYYLEFFSNLSFTNRIEIETFNESKILKIFILNEKAHVFIKEKEKNSISLRLDIIDLVSKKISKKTLFQVKKDTSESIFKALKNNYFIDLIVSSKIVLNFPYTKDKLTHAFVKVFDQNLEELNQYNVVTEDIDTKRNINFLNVKFLNKKVYLLFILSHSKNNDNSLYRLIEISKSTKRSLDIEIPKKTYEIINSKIKNNQMIIAGLYSNSKKGRFEGFTHYRINLDTFKLESKSQNLFNNEKARNYFSGIFNKNRSIDINNIFIDDELNTYIVGQLYILKKQSIPIGIPIGSFTVSNISVFVSYNPFSFNYKVFDNLLIGKINNKGILSWDKVLIFNQIEKIESKSNKRDSSIFSFFENNNINILINGYVNMKKRPFRVQQNRRLNKTSFYNFKINKNGEIIPNVLFPNLDAKIIFKADASVKSNNTIHILGQGNMRKQLLKIVF